MQSEKSTRSLASQDACSGKFIVRVTRGTPSSALASDSPLKNLNIQTPIDSGVDSGSGPEAVGRRKVRVKRRFQIRPALCAERRIGLNGFRLDRPLLAKSPLLN